MEDLKASDHLYSDQFRGGNAYVTNGRLIDGIYSALSKKSGSDVSGSPDLSAASDPKTPWVMDGFPNTYRSVEVMPGEAFLLPNLGCKIFESPKLSAAEYLIRDNFGHGVLPHVVDLYRPVLLIDFLLINEHTAMWEAGETGDLFCDLGQSSGVYKYLVS